VHEAFDEAGQARLRGVFRGVVGGDREELDLLLQLREPRLREGLAQAC
jgi:hypothetical protein